MPVRRGDDADERIHAFRGQVLPDARLGLRLPPAFGRAFGEHACDGHEAATVKARELLAENLDKITRQSSVDVEVKAEIDLMEAELEEIREAESWHRRRSEA